MFGGFAEWTYDEKSGYHFNAATGYYYDPNSGLYYSDILGMKLLHLNGLLPDFRNRAPVFFISHFGGRLFLNL
jgi:hypothetical protein